MQRINIILPDQLARDLRRSVPSRSRSKYIASALEEKLKRKKNLKRDFIKSLKANAEYDKLIAKEWKITETEGWPD